MADSDWSNLNNSLAPAEVAHDTTASLTPPNGGGTHVYAYNSLNGTIVGASGKCCDIANFKPTASGAWIAAAMKRLSSASNTGFSPLLYIQATGNDTADNAPEMIRRIMRISWAWKMPTPTGSCSARERSSVEFRRPTTGSTSVGRHNSIRYRTTCGTTSRSRR